MMRSELRARLLVTFRGEAEDLLATIGECLASGGEERARLEAMFRAVHTLKGAARSVGQREFEELCEPVEALLARAMRGEEVATPDLLRELAAARAAMADVLGELGRPAPEPSAPALDERAPAPAPLPANVVQLRLPVERLDVIVRQSEELLLLKLAAEARTDEAFALAAALDEAARLDVGRPGLGRDTGTQRRQIVQTLARQARRLQDGMTQDRHLAAKVVDGLLQELWHLRLVPVQAALGLMEPMVRDLAREEGKQVALEIDDGGLSIDRQVQEAIKPPLIQLLRNAVAHGIERPVDRLTQDKPALGRVRITVRATAESRIRVTVTDDGRGLDLAAIRAAAVAAGVATEEELRGWPVRDVMRLIFGAGLSTRARAGGIATGIAGHGMGMAIVAQRVEAIGGQVEVASEPGQGAEFRLDLPASIATFRGLLVGAGDQDFLLPMEAVLRVRATRPEELELIEGHRTLNAEGEVLPFADLAELLGLEAPRGEGARPVAILEVQDRRLALGLGQVLGEAEALLKEIAPPRPPSPLIGAAGLLGSGRLVLSLRPPALLAAALRLVARAPAAADEAGQRTILVVDDSITTRMMEKNMLEVAGYRVLVAVDGIDALAVLGGERVDLVVSDIDMPRMDGLELTRRIRANERLGELPVVLVTAMETREYKENGIRAGATAYIVKSGFDHVSLLDVIRRNI
jgi:two-component system chemotaxis sensor kinase CheA